MKRLLYILIVFTLSFLSCSEKSGTYYYVDEASNDTIASCLYCKGEDEYDTKFVIIVKDSIYEKEDIDELLKKLGIISVMSNAAKSHKVEKMLSPKFYIYVKRSSFSNLDENLYNGTNFYLRGRLFYDEWRKSREYDSYKIRLDENKSQIELLSLAGWDLKNKAHNDSIMIFKRDSMKQVFSRQYMKLSFMGYELGGSFYKKRKSDQYTIVSVDETIKGQKIDWVDISHYNNTIYKIEVYIKDHIKGIHYYQLEDILNLYREKYGNNYGGNEWIFSNSSIKIDTKLQVFTIGENGALFRGKHRGMPQRDVITEIIITYHDHEVDSILRIKRQKDEINEKKRLEKEEKHKHQQLLNNI